MKRRLRLTLAVFIALALLVTTASAVIAAYAATITVTNIGAAITRASVNTSMNVNFLASNGYITANGTDTRVDLAGTEYPHLLAEDRLVFAGPVPSGSTDYTFSTGSVAQDFYNTFGYDGYVTQADNGTLELGDNFTATVNGYINTSNGTDKHLIYKAGSVNISVSDTVSGNITARIGDNETASWYSPTGFGFYGSWVNVTNAYDENTATNSTYTWAGAGQSDYCYYSVNQTPVTGIRIWADRTVTNVNQMTLDLYHNGAWRNVIAAAPTWGTYTVYDLGMTVSTNGTRVRFNNSAAAGAAGVYEIDLLRNIPQQVSRTGITTGEHEIIVQMDSPFLSIAEDYGSTPITPVTDHLQLNLAMWQRDSSTSPYNSIDSNAFSVNVSGSTWTTSGYGFDAVNDYQTVANDASLNPNGSQSIELWVRFNTVGATDRSLWSNQIPGLNTGVWLFLSSTKKVIFYSGNGASWPGGPSSTTELAAATWYHITAVNNAGSMQIYINGVANGAPSVRNISGSTHYNFIGRYSEGASKWMDAIVGELRFYDDALTPAEVLHNYTVTKIKYLGTGDINTYSTLISVPDNANTYYYQNNGGATPNWMPYSSNISVLIGGNQRILFPGPNNYIRNTVLVNEASAGEPGVIHWGTNPSAITINNGGFAVGVTALESEELTTPDVAGIINQAQGQFYEDVPDTPITDIIADIAGLTSVPQLVLWYFLMLVFALAFFVKVHQWTGNLLIAGGVFLATVGAFVGIGAVPMWVPLVGILVLVSITALEARA